jgi:predicted acyltransferase
LSGGWCLLLLSFFYAVVDCSGWKAWSYPLRVIGRNSIVAYVLHETLRGFVSENLKRHLGPPLQWVGGTPPILAFREALAGRWGPDTFSRVSETAVLLSQGMGIVLVFWLVLFWMDRNKFYVRI